MTPSRPRVCVIGPMVGRNRGLVTTQGERLADLFSAAGYDVIAVSDLPNRYLRPIDMANTILSRRHEYDVAVLQVFSGPSFLVEDMSSLLLQRVGKPIIMVLRGGGIPVFASDHTAWTRRVFRRASAIITPSPFLARAIRPLGFDAQVIPNILELDRYNFRPRRDIAPRLFWMRSFHEIYNPRMALDVVARLRETHPDVRLTMAGSDLGQEDMIRRRAADMGLSGLVRFAGFLDAEQKTKELDAADIYLNTNRIDNMPVSVVEACASGLPVVATRVGGVSDILSHERSGLFVPEGDDLAMADAVRRLLRDPELVSRLSLNGRAVALRSSDAAIIPEWEALMARVAGNAAAA